MAQETGSQNKTVDFILKYQMYIIAAVLVILAIVYFSVNGGKDEKVGSENQNTDTEQSSGQNKPDDSVDTNQNGGAQGNGSSNGVDGNVDYSGVLKVSDNSSRGNLMVEGAQGKVYVSTKRDFSKQVNSEVKLNAEGTLSKFVFLGFDDSKVAGADTDAMGGAGEETAVSFTGMLKPSDNAGQGNLMIVSGNDTVFVKSVRNYSSLLESEVVLSALGTLDSFHHAEIVKK